MTNNSCRAQVVAPTKIMLRDFWLGQPQQIGEQARCSQLMLASILQLLSESWKNIYRAQHLQRLTIHQARVWPRRPSLTLLVVMKILQMV